MCFANIGGLRTDYWIYVAKYGDRAAMEEGWFGGWVGLLAIY